MKKAKLIYLIAACVLALVMIVSCTNGQPSETETDGETSADTNNTASDEGSDTGSDTTGDTADRPDNTIDKPKDELIVNIAGAEVLLKAPSFGSPICSYDDEEAGEYETDFSGISITLEAETYKIATGPKDEIEITVCNESGKRYCLYQIPYIQRLDKDTGEWVLLKYAPLQLTEESTWCDVLAKDHPNDIGISFKPYYMDEPLTPGTYRFLVFIDEYTFVSPEFEYVL